MNVLERLIESFTGIGNKKTEHSVNYKDPQISVNKDIDDGSIVITPMTTGGFFSNYIDLEFRAKNEDELITKYRDLASEPEFDYAISEIINEIMVIDEKEDPVKIDLEKTGLSDNIKNKIQKEFEIIIKLLNFTSKGYDIVRQWYVDGRLFYNIIIDEKNPKAGIQELRNIDPRKIRKIKEVIKDVDNATGVEVIKGEKDYFIFSDKGKPLHNGLKIHPDRVVFVHSGIRHAKTNAIVSHLQKAIKRFNELRLLEESVIIYRFTRAPQRNVFYVDIGSMPPAKGELYLNQMINDFRNKITYDSENGTIREDKRYKSMLDDYFIPRWNDKNTEIDTIGGSQLSNGMDDVENFRKQFYLALNVPTSRLESDTGFNMGRATEISREEVKFARFCTRLRVKFSDLFDDLLSKQIILKNIISEEDWNEIKDKVRYKYNVDTHFKELLDQEVWSNRIRLLGDIEPFTVRGEAPEEFPLFNLEWVRKHVLNMTEKDIEDMDKGMVIDKAYLERYKIEQEDSVEELDDEDSENKNLPKDEEENKK